MIYLILLCGVNPIRYNYGDVGPQGVGELYHRTVSLVRQRVIESPSLQDRLRSGELRAIELLQEEAQRILAGLTPDENIRRTIRGLLSAYIERKVMEGEFQRLPAQMLMFEVTVVNPYTRFGNFTRESYPLRCRIDEINITEGKIIERFSGREIPFWKPFQAWLNLQVIKTLDPSRLPIPREISAFIRSVIDRPLRVFVETPYNDLEVTQDFTDEALRAYRWYREAFSPTTRRGRFILLEKRRCGWPPEGECACVRVYGVRRRLSYPSGIALHRLRAYAIAELYDRVWNQHYLIYELSRGTYEEKLDRGLLWQGVVSHLNLESHSLGVTISESVRGVGVRPSDLVSVTRFSYCFGPRALCIVRDVERQEGFTNIELQIIDSSPSAFSPGDLGTPISVFREQQTSLVLFRETAERVSRRRQRVIDRCSRMGTNSADEFMRSNCLKLLQLVFGLPDTVREGPLPLDIRRRRAYERIEERLGDYVRPDLLAQVRTRLGLE
jgi:hypothetical protein